jgi:outer membrane protein insertion porin family
MIRQFNYFYLAFILFSSSLWSQDLDWEVQGIRVEGNQRISTGAVLNYLNISVGQDVSSQDIQESIKSLYSTGFFRDIEIRRLENLIIINVLERPSIADFSIEGNELIQEDDLQVPLTEAGLIQGEIFTQSTLDDIIMALTDQYYSVGHYALDIQTELTENDNNTVAIAININEGDRARVTSINIYGNTSFSDKDLLGEFEMSTGNMLSWIRQNDRYSSDVLETDLENLRSFYMNQGFADFQIMNTNVSISPTNDEIYISVILDEGQQYNINKVAIAGNFDEDRDLLISLVPVEQGEQYSQARIAGTEELLRQLFNSKGFAFAQVTGIPEINEETKLVDLTFFIDPQERIYVRRINFNGINSTDDEVLRRELRQFEGGFLSNGLLDRSQVRLQRLPFLEEVDYEVNPVPGVNDLVDVDFTLSERVPGQFGGGLGYSGLYGASINANVVHSNFLGRGERVALNLSYGEYAKIYSLSHTDQYANENALSRAVSFSYRDYARFTSDSSDSSLISGTAGVTYTIPISESQSLRYGINLQRYTMSTSPYSSDQTREWVSTQPNAVDSGNDYLSAITDTIEIVLGWGFDTRDRFLFPTRGTQVGMNINTTIPGGETEYYVGMFNISNYRPLYRNFILKSAVKIYYADSFGETANAPIYKNFYGGGSDSLRGIKDNYLGPIDSRGRPFGGNLMISGQFDLIFPTIPAFSNMRFGLYFDVGNLFTTANLTFNDKLGDPINYDLDYNNLKQSFGIAAEWLAPMGLLKFSYGKLLNVQEETDRFYGDRVEEFQFTMGNAF